MGPTTIDAPSRARAWHAPAACAAQRPDPYARPGRAGGERSLPRGVRGGTRRRPRAVTACTARGACPAPPARTRRQRCGAARRRSSTRGGAARRPSATAPRRGAVAPVACDARRRRPARQRSRRVPPGGGRTSLPGVPTAADRRLASRAQVFAAARAPCPRRPANGKPAGAWRAAAAGGPATAAPAAAAGAAAAALRGRRVGKPSFSRGARRRPFHRLTRQPHRLFWTEWLRSRRRPTPR